MGVETSSILKTIVSQFNVTGTFLKGNRFGSGHIHVTYMIDCQKDAHIYKYVLQRVNHEVFPPQESLDRNLRLITEHIRKRLIQENRSEISRRVLTLVPTHENGVTLLKEGKNYWRMFTLIEDIVSVDSVQDTEQAYKAAYSFGEFLALLSDLPAEKIHDIIPDFHHIGKRYGQLKTAIESDKANRLAEVQEVVDKTLGFQFISDQMMAVWESGIIPLRITHNDTKINNVLLDAKTGEGMCVIDLDTVMPGLILHDFGDMVRTFTSPVEEDERDLTKVFLRKDIFESLTKGFIAATDEFLTSAEREHLLLGAKVIILIMGVRFLTDYLNGDTYYQIHYPDQNLVRCNNQLALLDSLMEQEQELESIIQAI